MKGSDWCKEEERRRLEGKERRRGEEVGRKGEEEGRGGKVWEGKGELPRIKAIWKGNGTGEGACWRRRGQEEGVLQCAQEGRGSVLSWRWRD